MEGLQNFIESIQSLDQFHKGLVIDGFCRAAISAFKISKQQANDILQLKGPYTIIGLKVLVLLGEVPRFQELLNFVNEIEEKKEVLTIAFEKYPEEFLGEVLEKNYRNTLDIQQIVLEILENDLENTEKNLGKLETAIENLKKYSEGNTELSLNIHHKTASFILSKSPSLHAKYFEKLSEINYEENISETLINYVDILPARFFTKTITSKLELELLSLDITIRKKSGTLLKKLMALENNNSKQLLTFWEIYESLENYNKTLVAMLWKRIYSLFTWDVSKIKLLYQRARSHENLTVRRFIAKNYIKQTDIDNEFTVTAFIDYLSDPRLYSDSIELIGKSKFGIKISEFFINFIQTSREKDKFAVILIKNIFEKMEFQVGFRYFVEVIDKIFEEKYLDAEIIEKAYSSINRQLTQLTPFHRHTANLLLKRFVEVQSPEFLLLKVKLASKLPFICKIRLNLSESEQIIDSFIGPLIQGKKPNITCEEFGVLFSNYFDGNNTKVILPLFQSISSIYRSAYLKQEIVKTWIESLYYVLKYLNGHTSEQLKSFLSPALEEIFSYSLSLNDCELVKLFGKTIFLSLHNLKQSHIMWTFSKISILKDILFKQTYLSLFSTLYNIYQLFKFGFEISKNNYLGLSHELSAYILDIVDSKQSNRETYQLITPLKWKILSLISEGSSEKLLKCAHEILENSSLIMLKNIFDILSKNMNGKIAESLIVEISEKAWALVVETKNDAPIGIVTSFMRLAFNSFTIGLDSTPFLFEKVLQVGQDRWGIVRSLLYQCVPLWVQNPSSMSLYTNSIYQLTIYEETRSEDTDFFIPCIFALINSPKPHIIGDPNSLRSQYIRILTLFTIEKVSSNSIFIETLLEKACSELLQACQDRGEFPNSMIFKKKIRLGQLLCALCPWVTNSASVKTCENFTKNMIELLRIPYVHSARQYIERILINIMIKYPHFSEFIVLDFDMRPQLAGSFLLILGCVMVFAKDSDVRLKLFTCLFPFMISNTAHIRRIAHFVMFKLVQVYPEFAQKSIIFDFLTNNKECAKMMQRLETLLISFESFTKCDLKFILTGYFSDFDEILHVSLVSEIEEKTRNLLDTSYEVNFAEVWKKQAEDITENYESLPNFQRKVEDTVALVELRTMKGVQKRHELIIVASLVDKIPNLAGLTRTSEVFNLQMVTVAVKNIMNEAEFKSMAVTADKWLPIMEVPKTDLNKFLKLYRSNHYQIIGLEQTAKSVPLENFKFISKTVLVLGHEKDGIPGELLSLLDACIEIPQFGLIRSLNVHVSGSICIWEYIKQLYSKS